MSFRIVGKITVAGLTYELEVQLVKWRVTPPLPSCDCPYSILTPHILFTSSVPLQSLFEPYLVKPSNIHTPERVHDSPPLHQYVGAGGGQHHGKQELDGEDGDAAELAATRVTEKAAVAGSMVREADSVLNELVKLQQWQKEMENT